MKHLRSEGRASFRRSFYHDPTEPPGRSILKRCALRPADHFFKPAIDFTSACRNTSNENSSADHTAPSRLGAWLRVAFSFVGEKRVKGLTKKRRRKNGSPDKAILADVVRRIVEAATPDQIILFGSAARGEMGPDSDLDLLVIKAGKFNKSRLTTAIYRHLRGKAVPVDVVVVTPEEVERYGNSPYLVIYPALREGKIVYGA